MKYFSRAKLGSMYKEDGWRFVVEIVKVTNGHSTIVSYSKQTSPQTSKVEYYPEGNYPDEINPDEWKEFYVESKYNLNDGFVNTVTGTFYEVCLIEVFYYRDESKKFVYTIADIFGGRITFDEDILSEYVDKGIYRYIKISNEVNDCIEETEDKINPFGEI